MIYGFVQESSVVEILKQQRAAILSYTENHTLTVDEWIDPSLFKLKEFKEKDPELKPEAVNV